MVERRLLAARKCRRSRSIIRHFTGAIQLPPRGKFAKLPREDCRSVHGRS